MAIKGKQAEFTNYVKKVGAAEFQVICFNPDQDKIIELLNYPEAKEPVYLKEKTDESGTYDQAYVVVYLKDVKNPELTPNKVVYVLTNKPRKSKEGKIQYINSIGNTVWAMDEDELKSLATASNSKEGYRKYVQNFLKREYRIAVEGEEPFYDFIQKLTCIDTRDPEAELSFDLKKLFKGNFSELNKDLASYFTNTLVGNYEIISKRVDAHPDPTTGEIIPESLKEYQGVYNRFLQGSYMSYFTNGKQFPKYLQDYISNMLGENGTKNYTISGLARDYDPSENPINGSSSKHDETAIASSNVTKDPHDDLPF